MSTFPNRLDKYLGIRWLQSIGIVWLVLGSVAVLIDAIEKLRIVSKFDDAPSNIFWHLLLLHAPSLLLTLWPLVVLLGTLLCFSQLARTSEMVALRASGLSARRFLCAPAFAVVLSSIALVMFVQPVSATFLKKHETLQQIYGEQSNSLTITQDGSLMLRSVLAGGGYRLIRANGQPPILSNVQILEFSADSTLTARYDATSGNLDAGQWYLTDVQVYAVGKPVRQEESVVLEAELDPRTLSETLTDPSLLAWHEIPNMIKRLQRAGFSILAYQLQFQQLLALPWFALALFVLAAPFVLTFGRHSKPGMLLLAGIATGFGFYLLSQIIGTLALSGQLNAKLAAWTPTLIAAMLAAALLLWHREE